MLIHICGIDGSGKTTLVKSLHRNYRFSNFFEISNNVKLVNQVNRICKQTDSTRWEKFDNYFRSIIWANELLHISTNFKDKNGLIFVDRYKMCNLIYSQLEDKTSLKMITNIHKLIPDPDYVIFLDTPIYVAQKRIKNRGDYSSPKESPSNMKKADILYRKELEGLGEKVFFIDGSQNKDKVLLETMKIIDNILKKEEK